MASPNSVADGASTGFPLFRSQKEAADTIVETSPLFRDLPRPARSTIDRLGCEMRVHAGAVLARPRVRTREVIVVIEGRAVASEDGRVVARYDAGDTIGELAAVAGWPSSATVTAETPVRLQVYDLREFTSLLYAVPEVGRRMLTKLGAP